MENTLTTGRIYNVELVRAMFLGWKNATDGYALDYFFYAGRYLGPDRFGVEPLVSDPEAAEFYPEVTETDLI